MEDLRILIIGNGGREHALAWKLSQSAKVKSIWVAPGNGGTARGLANVQNVDIGVEDFAALISFAQAHDVNLVVPGPEVPLVAGIESACRAAGLRCFGPSKAAAQMEGSKAHSKAFMARHKIPTARFQSFGDYESARRYLDSVTFEVVLKASGLAAGKGVVIPESKEGAKTALKGIMLDKAFGAAGDEVVIEEFLEGDELSFLSFSDGYTIRSLPAAQDHKQINDGDTGPMTGGMGCYSPTTLATPVLVEEVHRTIIQPTIDGMRREGTPFVGMLFTGLMITSSGPKTLEYNVRFGDPETETILPLLSADTDLAEIMVACTDRYLDAVTINIDPKFSATVIAVAGGYPGKYAKGSPITLSTPPADTTIFHAGTTLSPSSGLLTSGGRVLAITSTGPDLASALSSAYTTLAASTFPDMYYRKDIGHRALSPSAHPADPTVVPKEALTYASAGVSIAAGNSLVTLIKPLVASTARPGADASIGGFGGVIDLFAAGYSAPPLILLGIDGVGTKLKIATDMNKHDTVGIDCVAMNVNDLVVQGAEALAFLDIYTCSALDVPTAASFVSGVAAGCRIAGCALAGGETAEMPGLIASGHSYDAAGAAIGAIEQGATLLPDKASMRAGDVVLGLASDGLHSNGFSLVRAILARAGLDLHAPAPWESNASGAAAAAAASAITVGESLLTPTRIYVKPLLRAARKGLVKGMAHITGGGLLENVPRMLPTHLAATIDARTYPAPEVMLWLKREGRVDDVEFSRVWNTGLGMVLVVGVELAVECIMELERAGERVFEVGRLVERDGEGCVVEGMEAWN